MDPFNSPTKEIKQKLYIQLVVALVILGAAVYIIFNMFIQNDFIEQFQNGNYPGIVIAVIIVAGLSFVSYIIGIFRNFYMFQRLFPVMESLSKNYGLQFDTSKSIKRNRFKPVFGVLHGKFNNKGITIFPAMDYYRKQNNNPKKITIFDTDVTNEWPNFTIIKNTTVGGFLNKLFGGVVYKDKFMIQPPALKGKNKTEIIAQIQKVLSDSVLYDFEHLPGKNTITVQSGLFTVTHDGFLYNTDEYPPYMNMLSKIQ